jgi:hypothetical protein
MHADPFAPLGGASPAPHGNTQADDFAAIAFEGEESDLTREMFTTPSVPNLVAIWPYRNAGGRIVAITVQYQTSGNRRRSG